MIRLRDPLEHRPTTRELIIAALASMAILLAIGEDQTETTATSPDPMTYEPTTTSEESATP